MKLTFWGATGTVTGSKYLVEAEGKRVLIDCGLFQGLKDLRLRNWGPTPFDPKSLDAVILTHAHIDHSGYVPVLVKRGFKGPVYTTAATRDLCKVLLPDSGKIQEEEAQYANRKRYSKHHPALPLYSQEEAEQSLKYFTSFGWENPFHLAPNFSFRFRRAGHILGAAFVILESNGTRLAFSGDLGRENDPVLLPPEAIETTDYLVVESTYGGRDHQKVDLFNELERIIKRTMERNGVVVIPAFSVGRTQTLLYCLHVLKTEKRISDVPIYLNSPMSINATKIFCNYRGEHRLNQSQCRGTCKVAKYIHSQEESKALNKRQGPMIIISASGMATGGRVLHHLKAFGQDAKNTILFTGFQAAGTRGAKLLSGEREIKIHGEIIPIQAEVVNIDAFSAHADSSEILSWLSKVKAPPKLTFITHGEPLASQALKMQIETKLGWKCQLPEYGQEVNLL